MRKLILPLFFLLFAGYQAYPQNDSYFEVSKNLDIFSNLYKQIDINYVDDVNAGKLMKTGIDAMLETLDPYTVYISEGDIEDYRFMTTGEYGGIGANFHLRDGVPEISDVHEGYPADEAGLKPGDRIMAINGRSVKGRTLEEIKNFLHGQPGTTINVSILKAGSNEDIQMEVTREKVKMENIPHYGMVGDGMAYIKLNAFTQNASGELQSAFNELKQNHDVKGLIIDLRDNGGGLLFEAVKICNLFVEKDELIVSTKGKLPSSNNSYKTKSPPVDKDIPLAVLINSKSASASEIVSGALQDLDRAVIIGQRSFGKGLVQNVFPLSYNAQVKVTTAKYYIPSGRCIQAIDYSHKNEEGVFTKIPDSLTSEFTTRGGRIVRDGGGIEPDLDIDKEGPAMITRALLRNFKIFDFATRYHQNNAEGPDTAAFKIDDQVYTSFRNYLAEEGFDYNTRTEEKISALESTAEKEGYSEDIEPYLAELRNKMKERKDTDLNIYKDEISRILRLEIISRYYYEKGKVISALSDDPYIVKAKEILGDKDQYAAILDQ